MAERDRDKAITRERDTVRSREKLRGKREL